MPRPVDRSECVNSSFIHEWRLGHVDWANGGLNKTWTIWYCVRCRKTEAYIDLEDEDETDVQA